MEEKKSIGRASWLNNLGNQFGTGPNKLFKTLMDKENFINMISNI